MQSPLALRSLALVVALTVLATACYSLPPLLSAAKEGDVERTKALIAGGVDVDQTSEHGWTAFMFAANGGHAEVVEVLLAAGADPNIESQRITGNTQAPNPKSNALREAIDNGHIDIANLLLDGGAEADPTAFAMAGGANDLVLLQRMLAMGADPNTPSPGPDAYHPSALCVASVEGRLEAARRLLDNGADPNLEALGCNALFAAVNGDHLEIAKLLVAHGADPDIHAWPNRVTPLLHCVKLHSWTARYDAQFAMLKLLLANNADREYRTEAWPYENRTALEYARNERDRAAERVELPRFGSDWTGGVSQLVEKLDAVIELLQE